jgi:hypothetical protein
MSWSVLGPISCPLCRPGLLLKCSGTPGAVLVRLARHGSIIEPTQGRLAASAFASFDLGVASHNGLASSSGATWPESGADAQSDRLCPPPENALIVVSMMDFPRSALAH